jgi:Flp pilus assembly pilin Flp
MSRTIRCGGLAYRCLTILASDDAGGEVIEYAIVLGLISIVGTVGTKVLARWNSVNSSM